MEVVSLCIAIHSRDVAEEMRRAGALHLIEPWIMKPFQLNEPLLSVMTVRAGCRRTPSLVRPVLVLRDTTERPKLAAGTVEAGGNNQQRIYEAARLLFNDKMSMIKCPGH